MTSRDRDKSLEECAFLELLDLRKSRLGITVDSIAHAHTICQLLGSGDPFLAYSRIRHEILDSDFGLSIMAAAASLGLTAEGEGHLNRLTAFGNERYLDQRQVRRYSDKGIRELAKMITTNWPTETSPVLMLFLSLSSVGWEIQIYGHYLQIVEMKRPLVTVLTGDTEKHQSPSWNFRVSDSRMHFSAIEPVIVESVPAETSIVVVWRGELWPKFNVAWNVEFSNGIVEMLGNKLLIRLPKLSANN